HLAPLMLLVVSPLACPGQNPPDSGHSVLEGETFEGRTITRLEFEPAAQPLQRDELDRRILPLRAQSPLQIEDVRGAIRGLFATGRFANVTVDAQADGAGVALKFVTELRYFVSGVNIEGAADPPNREQLRAAAKIELGAPFSTAQISQAILNMQER